MSSLRVARLNATSVRASSAAPEAAHLPFSEPLGVVAGTVVACHPDGTILVDYLGNAGGPLPARTLMSEISSGDPVLLVFERGIPSLPIILGVVLDRANRGPRTLHLKAERIVLSAQEQLTLECGGAGLEVARSGAVHLKGKDIVSRARRTNKVRGATVQIN